MTKWVVRREEEGLQLQSQMYVKDREQPWRLQQESLREEAPVM